MIHARHGLALVLFTLATLLTACASKTTTVTEMKGDSHAAGEYTNILVVAASQNERVRSTIGQALSDKLNHKGISATYLASDDYTLPWTDPIELRTQLLNISEKGQHDGVLVVSLVDSKHHDSYTPETVAYIPDHHDIGPTASMTYIERSVQPETFDRSVEYVIQSTLYDSHNGQAVWRVVSSTVDPDSLEAGTEDFASVITRALNDSVNWEPEND